MGTYTVAYYAFMDYFAEASRQPGVGYANSSTPWRRRTSSIASSVEGDEVGGRTPCRSQYRAARGQNPASVDNWACVSPAITRAALNWRAEIMLLLLTART